MKKLFKKATAALLVLAMLLGMSTTVMAADEEKSTTLSITKQLDKAEGITTPAATFTFKFEQQKTAGYETTDFAIADATISYAEGDEDVVKSTADLLSGKKFPHAGVFAYKVTETSDTYGLADDGSESMDYSKAEYLVRIYVKNVDTNGDGIDDDVAIDEVTVEKEKDDEGNDIEGTTGKVDGSTPDTDDGSTDEGGTGEGGTGDDGTGEGGSDDTADGGNGFRFVNVYDKKAGTDEDGDGKYQSLTITNTAAGEYGNKEAAANYTLTLKVPSTASDVAMSYSVNGVNAVEVEGNTVTFALKHGEEFVLYDAPAGTTYTVVQAGVDYHVTSAVIVENGGEAYSEPDEAAEAGAGLTVADKLIGEKLNKVDFTNTRDAESVTPTGIIINNLPYALMVLIAALGICMIVVSKKRRA